LLRIHPALGALLLASLLACTSNGGVEVSANYDPLVTFPAEATYVWDLAANALPEDSALDRAGTDALLRSVADEAFAEKGWRVASKAPADFSLSYQFTVHTYIGPNASLALGSLSLLMSEGKTGRRVWAGFGRAEIHNGLSEEERRARLADGMERMLANFPPRQRPD
jgi:hypothetical protein